MKLLGTFEVGCSQIWPVLGSGLGPTMPGKCQTPQAGIIISRS